MPPHVLFFDLETTGTQNQRITQIGALACELSTTLPLAGTFNKHVNPQEPVAPEVARMTGVTSAQLERCATVRAALVEFASFIRRFSDGFNPLYIVAHGGDDSDFKILRNELKRSQLSLDVRGLRTVDSLKLFRNYLGGPCGLDDISERLNTATRRGTYHDALKDCEILRECCAKIPTCFVPSVPSLAHPF